MTNLRINFILSFCRSSTSSAAAAFAIATSGSSNPRDLSPINKGEMSAETADELSAMERARYKENVISTACTMRVLNVLRHWISKHSQDFERDLKLKSMTVQFLDDVIYSPNLLPVEHKAAAQLLRLLTEEEIERSKIDHIVKLLDTTPVNIVCGFKFFFFCVYYIK